MADYTYATAIIHAADQAAAHAEYPDYFNSPASVDGSLPTTAYFTSGPFGNDELDTIVNETNWWHRVYFGEDWQGALAKQGLMPVIPPAEQV